MDERRAATRGRTAVGPALLWATFAQCAAITALLVPAHILVQGILGPLGWLPYPDQSYDKFAAMIGNPLVKLYLLVLFATSFYVAAHRVRYLLLDLGLHRAKLAFGLLLYGLAVIGTLIAAYLLFTLP
jgi:fumarate reductase subunit D